MAQTRKYKVGCSGSGWGVWEIATGNNKATQKSGFIVAHCQGFQGKGVKRSGCVNSA